MPKPETAALSDGTVRTLTDHGDNEFLHAGDLVDALLGLGLIEAAEAVRARHRSPAASKPARTAWKRRSE